MLPFHALFVVASILGQPGNLPSFIKKYSRSMTFYYESTDPSRAMVMMKAFLEKSNIEDSWYENKAHVQAIIGSQFADIARGNPQVLRSYEEEFETATTTAGRKFLLKVLAQCGDQATALKAQSWLNHDKFTAVRPGVEALKKILDGPPPKHVADRAAKTPDDLDLLWANFFITGRYPAVSRILDVLDLPEDRQNAVLKRVARWSLASNLQQHPKLTKLVNEHLEERGELSRKAFKEITLEMAQSGR